MCVCGGGVMWDNNDDRKKVSTKFVMKLSNLLYQSGSHLVGHAFGNS